MSAHSQSLILHQYEMSPFSEKIRVIFGMKGLEWHACDQPRIMPKPDLVALTGGYRRIPVLQIGADLYFDTMLIIDELERRFPTPSVYDGVGRGMAQALEGWADQGLFWQVVTALFGGDIPADAAFMADRSALLGRPFDQAAMKAASPEALRLMAGYFDLAEQQLADGRAYLFGAQPGAVDASLYHNVAFLRWGRGRAAKVLDGFPRLLAWEARVRAIGHGRRGADVSGQDAIGIARDSVPAPTSGASVRDDFKPGAEVTICYNDANTPVLNATIIACDLQRIAVQPSGAMEHGTILHMPLSIARFTPGGDS
jgi:glutathione S-transferase